MLAQQPDRQPLDGDPLLDEMSASVMTRRNMAMASTSAGIGRAIKDWAVS